MKQLLFRAKRLRSEVLWLAGGHLIIGLGGILGIALITRLMDAASFGVLSLYVGIASLGLSMFINPVIQTGMRFFSAAADETTLRQVRAITMRWLTAILSCVACLAIAIAFLGGVTGLPWQAALLIAGLLSVDAYRAYETSMLNAARLQRQFVLWRAADAWVRPLGAVLCVLVLGVAAWPALLGYMLGTLVIAMLFWSFLRPSRLALTVVSKRATQKETLTNKNSMIRYALPLVPIGLLGWILGSGDRYIIGGMISLEAAGLYAAIYSVTSRPFLAIGAFLDVLLRPRLYDAASSGNWKGFRNVLTVWLGVCGVVSIIFFLITMFLADPLTSLLLGPNFADSAALMPWIALGYGLNTAYQPFLRTMHSLLLSSYTLVIQIVTTVLGVTATVLGIWVGALLGAAIAIPVYFGLRLVVTALLLSRSEKARQAIFGDGV
jgi:O-antigen/teichoic acid export membrane protein